MDFLNAMFRKSVADPISGVILTFNLGNQFFFDLISGQPSVAVNIGHNLRITRESAGITKVLNRPGLNDQPFGPQDVHNLN